MKNQDSNDAKGLTQKAGAGGSAKSLQQHVRLTPMKLVLVIVLDATESMTPYVEAVRRALQRMLSILIEGKFDPQVGLVVFRDEREGEMPEVYAVGTPIAELKKILAGVVTIGGGSIPESSLAALMRAVAMLDGIEQGIPCVFLHVTDAPCHDPEAGHTAKSVLDALKQRRVFYFAGAPNIQPYRTFSDVTGGTLFPIVKDLDSETFQAVLVDFAKTTLKTVRASEMSISDEVRELLRSARADD